MMNKSSKAKLMIRHDKAFLESSKVIEALNMATNPKTTVLANIMFEALRQKSKNGKTQKQE